MKTGLAIRRERYVASALVVLLSTLSHGEVRAQYAETTMPALTAALLFNFAKFAAWPEEALATAAPMVLCVTGDLRVQKALEKLTQGRAIQGHPIIVRAIESQILPGGCHLLYAADLNSRRALELLKRLKGAPVLSVSDFSSFARLGGSAQFYTENGRMRFAVNIQAVRRSQLRVSSGLLSLAKIVEDDPNPPQQ